MKLFLGHLTSIGETSRPENYSNAIISCVREKFDEARPTVLYVFIVILVERTGSERFEAINFFCARDAETFRLNKRFF